MTKLIFFWFLEKSDSYCNLIGQELAEGLRTQFIVVLYLTPSKAEKIWNPTEVTNTHFPHHEIESLIYRDPGLIQNIGKGNIPTR